MVRCAAVGSGRAVLAAIETAATAAARSPQLYFRLHRELAALTDSEGRPYAAVKRALAEYVGGAPSEICLTSNTTGALAMTYPGLRIRRDQEILTTEHDHYSHHESIRYAAARSACGQSQCY